MLKKISALLLAIAMLMSSPLLSNNASAVSGFEIADATVSSVSENVLATISEIDGLTVYNKIIFHQVDDYADLTLTILNNTRNIRKISDITDNNTNPFVSYSYNNLAGEEIAPNSIFSLTIRVTCLGLAQEAEDLTQQNNVAFIITFDEIAVDSDDDTISNDNSEEIELVIPSVPDTGLGVNASDINNSHASSIITIVVGGIGLIIMAFFFSKKRTKITALVFVVFTAATTSLMALSASADDNIGTFNLNSVISFRNTIHVKYSIVVDGQAIGDFIDEHLPFELLLQAQYTPGMLTEMINEEAASSGFALIRAEYSNGLDDEAVDPDAPILDDVIATLYYKSNLTEYHISYNLDGGTVAGNNPTTYTKRDYVEIINPEKEGMLFVGWTVDIFPDGAPQRDISFNGANVAQDLVFTAHWRTAYVYNITYDLDGGTLSTSNPTTYTEGSAGFVLNNPTKKDWVFTGWTVTEGDSLNDTPKKEYRVQDLTSNITVKANWKMVYITFATDSRWASAVPGVPVENERIRLLEDDEITAPDGYWSNEDDNEWMLYFDAWYTNAWTRCTASGMGYINCSGEPRYAAGDVIKAAGTLPDKDIIVYPGYIPYEHAITYLLGEGGHFEGDYPATYNFFSEFDIPAPVREGYIFTGWKAHGLIMHHLAHYHAHWAEGLIGINRGPVTIEALWEEAKTMDEFEYIQDINYGNCVATPVGTAVTLKDKRDEKSYRIKRLEDGRCWMTDNLSITGVTLTSDNSDIADGTTFTLPESNINSVSRYWAQPAYVGAYDDPTYGGYYTFNAATAGSGASIGSNEGESAPYSICPKNWKLPSGPKQYKGKEEYTDLFDFYSDKESILNSNLGPNFILNGYADWGEINYSGTSGHYWTSTSSSSRRKEAYMLDIYDNPDSFNHSYWSTDRLYGAAVRCYLWD